MRCSQLTIFKTDSATYTMARTKQFARRARIHWPTFETRDFTVPPNSLNLISSDPTDVDSLDTPMDIEDDDGGVPLSTPDDNVRPSNEYQHLDDHEIVQKYHQNQLVASIDVDCLWRLPVQPIFEYRASLPALSTTHPVADTYHHCCSLIWSSWRCEPENCVPAALRPRTPFSLALLSQIRRLASNTKLNMEGAQSELIRRSQQRIQNLATLPKSINLYLVKTSVTHPNLYNCEVEIHENAFGLMLEDVEEVLKNTPLGTKKARRQAKHEGNLAKRLARHSLWDRDNDTSAISDRVKKTPRNAKPPKPLNDGRLQAMMMARLIPGPESPDHTCNGVSAAPPNSPVLTATQPKVQIPATNVADRVSTNHNSKEAPPADENDNGRWNPSRYDHHIDWQVTSWFNKMSSMDSEKGPRSKDLRKLKAGGASRKKQGSAELPSERIDLDSLPTLHAQAGAAKAAEVASALKSLDLDQG